jgi:hypothetical protein
LINELALIDHIVVEVSFKKLEEKEKKTGVYPTTKT